MNTTHKGFLGAISAFGTHFRTRTWNKALILLIGAILCPGARTVANCLRTLGLDDRCDFAKYHRVFSRAPWSALVCAGTLLKLLTRAFASGGTYDKDKQKTRLVFAIDETIERRWGRRIRARGIYRDAVRSSSGTFQKTSGLRWMCVTLLTSTRWSKSVWAMPVLTTLCPSRRYYDNSIRSVKKLTDFARGVICWLARRVVSSCTGLGRPCILTADRSYCTYALLDAAHRHGVSLVTDMRLDARLFEEPPVRSPGQRGRPPYVGQRLRPMDHLVHDDSVVWNRFTSHSPDEAHKQRHHTFDYISGKAIWYKPGEARVRIRWVLVSDPLKVPGEEGYLRLLVTSDVKLSAQEVINYYLMRWSCEVTFAEVRRHLGVETQRQWSDKAIARTTPCTMALYSVTCLLAHHANLEVRPSTSAWYRKPHVTFSDVLGATRRQLWKEWINQPAVTHSNVDKPSTTIRYLTAKVRSLERALIRCAA